jgi:hypothetical protein
MTQPSTPEANKSHHKKRTGYRDEAIRFALSTIANVLLAPWEKRRAMRNDPLARRGFLRGLAHLPRSAEA